METGKPQISILMAVYEPKPDWLREQLESLEAQTYPNLRLYIRDDCSPAVPFGAIKQLVQECIRSFPYEIHRNKENLGSNLTFQQLTEEAEGAYFAYCDQDDVWLPEKLTVLQEELERSGAQLACSDMYIINAEGEIIADSIRKMRRRHRFHSGTGLAGGLLFHNFAAGCTMLVRAEAAKAAVPFCPYMVHDHYIALRSAVRGGILTVPSPMIRYRIHGGNQTGLLAGVVDKKSYGQVRICDMDNRLRWLEENAVWDEETRQILREGIAWAEARKRNWSGQGGKMLIWKYRRFDPLFSLFEIFAAELPEQIFRFLVKVGKQNRLIEVEHESSGNGGKGSTGP